MNYTIVTGEWGYVIQEVNKRLLAGWNLVGGVVAIWSPEEGEKYAQALTNDSMTGEYTFEQ